MRQLLVNLPRLSKRLIIVLLDAGILLSAMWLAFVLRFGDFWPNYLSNRIWILPLIVAVSIPVFYSLGFYRSIIRYVDSRTYVSIAQGLALGVLVTIAIWVFTQALTMPRSIWINYWLIAFVLISGSRVAARTVLYRLQNRLSMGERAVIYGAGDAGVQLARALQHSREYRPVLFLDDNPELQGGEIMGLKILPPERLPKLIDKYRLSIVMLAMPSVSRSRRQRILARLEPLIVHVMAMPGLSELASGVKRVDDVREVDVEDILGRDPVQPEIRMLSQCITGKSVMVTGGGGSIGGELCRQIVGQAPARLVVYEVSEYALYNIERRLKRLALTEGGATEIIPILGSVTDQDRLQQAMIAFNVQTVYHAAAYKHVPIVEQNPLEGVRNNILGTWRAAMAAQAASVETFVLVSTDKAVRPTNVMGATKRVAELVLQSLAQTRPVTRYCMVRFGNVLASSGSVVPLFREQIRTGGPVTVTHAEIERYFMTIPEAAQLVIQASAAAQGGDVLILDMGEPVRIIDLARRMIRLHGFTVKDADHPEGDIEIEIAGLRPAEKLFEELLVGENAMPTQHPMIYRTCEDALPQTQMHDYLKRFEQAIEKQDHQLARQLLQEAVGGYLPGEAIEDHVWRERDKRGTRTGSYHMH